MIRSVRGFFKAQLFGLFRLMLKFGWIVLPKHYYVPVSDVNELARTKEIWAKRTHMRGIDINIDHQIKFLQDVVKPYQAEYLGNEIYLEGVRRGFGPGYGFIEAQAYHGVLRGLKPRRIVEVGSGVSTYCAVIATRMNAIETKLPVEIICIEPNPSQFLKSSTDITLIPNAVEHVPLSFFDSITLGDMLFIDSSHAVRPGGDVVFLYCEVLPRLAPGVIIHIHDIYFPFNYQGNILTSLFQWSETCMLQALLVNNSNIEILCCLSVLHYDAPNVLREVFPEYNRRPGDDGLHLPDQETHFPSSIYLRTK